MAKYWVGLALALAVQWPELAAAQSPQSAESCVAPSSDETEAAKHAFRDGQLAFSEGDYQRAAELWQSAYDQDCTAHALLLNLAMAQELLGRPDMAAQTLERFNDRAPNSPYADANRQRIARLQRAPVSSTIRPRREAPRACPAIPTAAAPVSSRTGVRLPIAVALGGGLAAVLGGAFYAEARVAASKASDACSGPPGECTSRNAVTFGERARARAEASGWIAGIGLVTLTGGLVWELLSDPQGHAPETGSRPPLRLGSSVGADRVQLELSAGF
jgi:tetratricopeptide (TPR) repeat protein